MKRVLSQCIICKIVHGKTLLSSSATKFREYRLYFEHPFGNVLLDYVGQLFTRYIFGNSGETFKSYIFKSCAATRNTHLELVLTYLQRSSYLQFVDLLQGKNLQELSLVMTLRPKKLNILCRE